MFNENVIEALEKCYISSLSINELREYYLSKLRNLKERLNRRINHE